MSESETILEEIVVTGPPVRLRRPRARILVNGTELPGLKAANVRKNNYFHADTFAVEFAQWAPGMHAPDWWLTQDDIEVEVQMGREPDEGEIAWRTVLKGKVDDIDMEGWSRGTIGFKGRDKTALFLDNKTREAFKNKTASQVVEELASRHGMTAEVTATTTLAGTYYERDHVSLSNGNFSRDQTEWDTITYLARQEGFDAWVDGDVVHFAPLSEDRSDAFVVQLQNPTVQDGVAIAAQSNVMGFKCRRNLALAKNIKVVVRSWNSNHGRRYEAKKESDKPARGFNATSGRGGGDDVTEYYFTYPNLTQDEAQKRATRLHEQISRQQWNIDFEMPATLNMNPRRKVVVDGVAGLSDQLYYVDTVDMRIDSSGSWLVSVAAKNTPEPNGDAPAQ